jgi:hypothetical protein
VQLILCISNAFYFINRSNSSSTVLSGLSQTNGRTSVFETIAKHKSSATSSPRETRVFGTANAVTTYNMSEGAAKNLKLSGRQLWEFGTASESDNKVHVNSCSPMSRRSEPHKVSLTADKRTNFVKQNRYSASKVLRAQSNNHAMQSEFDDADGGDVNWKSSGCADDRCPMTGLVATRCSKTQSPKISLIAAVSNNVRQDVRNEQNWKVSPRRDDLHSKQSGHLPRLSVGRGRPSSSVFRQVTCGPVNDHNQSEKSVGHGSYVAAVSSARPVSIYPARSNPISSYKPASHHEPCFDV